MSTVRKWVIIIWPTAVVTVFAFVACFSAIRPMFEPIGLRSHDTTAVIRHAFPIRLVQPQSIADRSNLYIAWSTSEARARFLLILVCWVAASVTLIYIRVKRSPSAQT